jgi:hypothetical protein
MIKNYIQVDWTIFLADKHTVPALFSVLGNNFVVTGGKWILFAKYGGTITLPSVELVIDPLDKFVYLQKISGNVTIVASPMRVLCNPDPDSPDPFDEIACKTDDGEWHVKEIISAQ